MTTCYECCDTRYIATTKTLVTPVSIILYDVYRICPVCCCPECGQLRDTCDCDPACSDCGGNGYHNEYGLAIQCPTCGVLPVRKHHHGR